MEPQGFVHQAHIYGSRQEFVWGALSYLRDGVRSGEPVLVTVPEANLGPLHEALGADASGADLRPAEHWYENPARTRSKVLDWISDHANGGRVRLVDEPPWPLGSEPGIREWARHEAILNLVLARQRVTFVCPYSAALPAEILQHARCTHPELRGVDRVTASDGYVDPWEYCRRLDSESEAPHDPPVLELSFGPRQLASVRRMVERAAIAAGMSKQQIEELVYAVNEVATNSLVHGAGAPTLRVWRHPAEIVCEVTDDGSGPDPLAGQLPHAPSASSGWGLWTARQMCEAIEVRAAASGNAVAVYAALATAVQGHA